MTEKTEKSTPDPEQCSTPVPSENQPDSEIASLCAMVSDRQASLPERPEMRVAKEWAERIAEWPDVDDREIQYGKNREMREQSEYLDKHACLLGERYRSSTIESFELFDDSQRSVIDRINTWLSLSGSVYRYGNVLIHGPIGTGKDHLMAGMIKKWSVIQLGNERRQAALFMDAQDIFASAKAEFSREFTGLPVTDKCVRANLLYISDPSPPAGTLSEFEQRLLYRILDTRYRAGLPTWFTCNINTRGELDERVGPRNADRMVDGSLVIHTNWSSYRKPGKF